MGGSVLPAAVAMSEGSEVEGSSSRAEVPVTCSLCVQRVGRRMALSAEYALWRMGGSVLPAAVAMSDGSEV